jgi:hypothetical protein
MSVAERWRPMTGKVYRIGDRLLRLLYVRGGEPTFEVEIHPLPIECPQKTQREVECQVDDKKSEASKVTPRSAQNFDLEPSDPSMA